MKKFFISAILCLISICGFAQIAESTAEGMTTIVYAQSSTVQQNGTGIINIVLKSDTEVGTIACWFTLPDGITVDETNSKSDGGITYNYNDGLHKFTIQNGSSWDASEEEPQVVAQIAVNVANTVELGTYDLKTQHWEVTTPELVTTEGSVDNNTNVIASLTVQREEVIADQDEGYVLEVIPFEMEKTVNYDSESENNFSVDLNMENTATVKSISFTMELPEGIEVASVTEENPDYDPDDPNSCEEFITSYVPLTVVSDRDAGTGKTYTSEITKNEDGSYYVYLTYSKGWLVKAVSSSSVAPIYLVSNSLKDGVYEMKLKDINITQYNKAVHSGGEYIASVFVGTPTETDPVVYGHYTTEGQAALKAASTNFASVDMKVATVDAEEAAVAKDLAEILVYGPKNTSYNRTLSTTYGTVCLPFALTSGTVQYYELESVADGKMTFAPVDEVAANVPAIFKGNIAESVDGYQYAAKAGTADEVDGYTLTGTYAKLVKKTCTYISQDKFWNDYATVAPFRAYFDSGDTETKSFTIAIHDETGIHDITSELSNDDIYTLQGILVKNAQKGVNIIGGKKVYIKK